AEDGIRDRNVTGVQTCALPISNASPESLLARGFAAADSALRQDSTSSDAWMARAYVLAMSGTRTTAPAIAAFERAIALDPRNARSEERRVGKEGRTQGSA